MSLAGRELDNAICHICQEYLTDPVTIECGHNFCQGCITQRCEGVETAACPQCGEMFQKRAFRPNTLLGSIIQSIKQVALNSYCQSPALLSAKIVHSYKADI
uniref:RING-type domain-containing protein n=1 Tax=Chrysemys picta bellii TaxID=8478 RepID=A0A8C3HT52_CHRPI